MGQADAFRYLLTNIHGNVGGSIQDGPATGQSLSEDPPAAARYLEVKSTALVERMFISQINRNYGEWRDSYDGSTKELSRIVPPLPALLINGSQGIASGYACYHIPYNITDVINATTEYIKNKRVTPAALRAKFAGPPDFPQGGRVVKDQGLVDAMVKGQGAVKVYGNWEVIKNASYGKKAKRDMLVITSLPYGSSEKFLEKVHALVDTEKLVGIVDASDLSSRDGIRVQLVLKPGADVDNIISVLVTGTNLCHTHNVNATAVINGLPVVLGVRDIIAEWYNHRQSYLKEQYKSEIGVIKTDIERFGGVLTVLGDVDKLLNVLKKSKTRDQAATSIKKAWKLTDLQVGEVLSTPISKLIATEIEELKAKIASFEAKQAQLELYLTDSGELDKEMMAQIAEFKVFGGTRRAKYDVVEVKKVVVQKQLTMREKVTQEGKELGMSRTEINEYIKNRGKYRSWEQYKEDFELKQQLTTRDGRKKRKERLSQLKTHAEACGMAKRGRLGWTEFMKSRQNDSLSSITDDLLNWQGVDKAKLKKLV